MTILWNVIFGTVPQAMMLSRAHRSSFHGLWINTRRVEIGAIWLGGYTIIYPTFRPSASFQSYVRSTSTGAPHHCEPYRVTFHPRGCCFVQGESLVKQDDSAKRDTMTFQNFVVWTIHDWGIPSLPLSSSTTLVCFVSPCFGVTVKEEKGV